MRRLQLIDSYCSTHLYYRVCYVQMAASINATRSCGPCCLNCFALLTVEKFDAAALLHSQLRGSIYAQSVFNSQRIIYGMANRVGWVKNRVRARYVTAAEDRE